MSILFGFCDRFIQRLLCQVSPIPFGLLVALRLHWTSHVYHQVLDSMDRLREEEGERHSCLFLVFQFGRGVDCPLLCHSSDGSGFHPGLFTREFYLSQKPLLYLQEKESLIPSRSIGKRGCHGRQEDILGEENPENSAFYRSLFISDLCETPVPRDIDWDDVDLFGGGYSDLGSGPSSKE
jgi:hypothetical protein